MLTKIVKFFVLLAQRQFVGWIPKETIVKSQTSQSRCILFLKKKKKNKYPVSRSVVKLILAYKLELHFFPHTYLWAFEYEKDTFNFRAYLFYFLERYKLWWKKWNIKNKEKMQQAESNKTFHKIHALASTCISICLSNTFRVSSSYSEGVIEKFYWFTLSKFLTFQTLG